MDKPSILAIDQGRTTAAMVSAHDGTVVYQDVAKIKDNITFFLFAKNLIEMYEPDVILHDMPLGMRHKAIVLHSKFIGMLYAAAYVASPKKKVEIIECRTNHCRKVVFGKDIGKKACQEHYGEETDHEADCRLFIDYYLNHYNENT